MKIVLITVILAVGNFFGWYYCYKRQKEKLKLQQKKENEILRNKLEKEKVLLEAKNHLMVSQLNSHFIFNTLNAISALCHIDPDKANEVIIQFGNYLRANIMLLEGNSDITFEEEMRHIKNYLQIESLRYGERINIIYNLQYIDFSIPLLTIEPIVENAVRHGLQHKREGGTISISSRKNGNYAEVIIEDDGIGFDINSLKDIQGGICNITKRLKEEANATVEIESTIGKGTKVLVRLSLLED